YADGSLPAEGLAASAGTIGAFLVTQAGGSVRAVAMPSAADGEALQAVPAADGQDVPVVLSTPVKGTAETAAAHTALLGSPSNALRPDATLVVNGPDLGLAPTTLVVSDGARKPVETAAASPSFVAAAVGSVPAGATPAALLTHIESGTGDRLDVL